MPNIDKKWVEEQLSLSNTDKKTSEIINYLIDGWSKLDVKSITVQKDAIEKFSKLAIGIPIFVPVQQEEIWIQAMPGRLVVGDEVLVREDAFSGELAPIHNGRRGRIVAIRYGDIIVNSTDDMQPSLVGTHYSPYHLLKLEKR